MNTIKNFVKKIAAAGLCAVLGFSAMTFTETSIGITGHALAASAMEQRNASVDSVGVQVIQTGKRFIGVSYKFGSKSGSTATFDCSSFTQYVFKQHGIDLPRVAKNQATVGVYVSRNNLQVGDLIFFHSTNRVNGINHVAIYAGNGMILHTYGAPGVTMSNLNQGVWDSGYITARRVL